MTVWLKLITIIGLTLLQIACSDNNEPPTTDVLSDQGETEDWVSGVFQPDSDFKDQCENPRTGSQYSDVQGTVLDENNWLRSWSNDVYLWYNEIPDQNPADYSTTSEYFQQLKTPAKTESGAAKDQHHFEVPSKELEESTQSGVSIGYGAEWVVSKSLRAIVVAFTQPDSPATNLSPPLVRGTKILEVDGVDITSSDNTSNDIDTFSAGIYPDNAGETHTFKIEQSDSSIHTVTMTSARITSDPVQNIKTIDTSSGKVGYMLFNEHTAVSGQPLINAMDQFKNENVSELILDLRYNGGGFGEIAAGLASMIVDPELTKGSVFATRQYNDKHPDTNPVTGEPKRPYDFLTESSSGEPLPTVNLSRVYIITGEDTCSASEMIINGLRGVGVEVIQVGSKSCGKPFGFVPVDNCGTSYLTINLQIENDKGFGDYQDGFLPENATDSAGVRLPGCSVADDFSHPLGDPKESRLEAALEYMASGTCPAQQQKTRSHGRSSLKAFDGVIHKPFWQENIIWGQP